MKSNDLKTILKLGVRTENRKEMVKLLERKLDIVILSPEKLGNYDAGVYEAGDVRRIIIPDSEQFYKIQEEIVPYLVDELSGKDSCNLISQLDDEQIKPIRRSIREMMKNINCVAGENIFPDRIYGELGNDDNLVQRDLNAELIYVLAGQYQSHVRKFGLLNQNPVKFFQENPSFDFKYFGGISMFGDSMYFRPRSRKQIKNRLYWEGL